MDRYSVSGAGEGDPADLKLLDNEVVVASVVLDAIGEKGQPRKGGAEEESESGSDIVACQRVDDVLVACSEVVAGQPDRGD